jgi:hypothetical protein
MAAATDITKARIKALYLKNISPKTRVDIDPYQKGMEAFADPF